MDDPVLVKRMAQRGYLLYYPSEEVHASDSNGGHDVFYAVHGNGLVVVGLDAAHPAVAARRADATLPLSVSFDVDGQSYGAVAPKGKKKSGAPKLRRGDAFCVVTVGAQTFKVRIGFPAPLIEVNTRLIDNPHFAVDLPATDGYLAVFMPNEKAMEKWEAAEWRRHPGHVGLVSPVDNDNAGD